MFVVFKGLEKGRPGIFCLVANVCIAIIALPFWDGKNTTYIWCFFGVVSLLLL